MNVRQAILKAADSIEQNPELFNFGAVKAPNKSCGSPACAIGWIGFHLGLPADAWMGSTIKGRTVYEHLGIAERPCFDQLTAFIGNCRWKDSSDACAQALRKYADKYHPEDKPFTRWWESVEKELVA